jgi:glycosyltransferase involved in cell wall biosynthesis
MGGAATTRARVAVAIPTRDRPAWCEEAVRSALAQEGVEVEVSVALDGEQPETRARLARIGDPRVRVVAGPASGRSAARNRAVRASTAPLVAFLDDDDRLLPGALRARVEALARHPEAVLVHGRPATMDAQGAPDARSLRAAARGRETCGDRLPDHLRGRSLFPSTALLRREAFDRAGGFDDDLATGEDWAFFLRLAAVGPFVFLPSPTVLYRRHAGQIRGDPASQEASLSRWISRYFDDPATPVAARRFRRRLVGTHLNWIARNHRAAGDEAAFRRCFRAAVRENPRLLLHPKRALRFLRLAFAR